MGVNCLVADSSYQFHQSFLESELAFGTFGKLIGAYEAEEVELIAFRSHGKQQLSLNLAEDASQMRCELVSR